MNEDDGGASGGDIIEVSEVLWDLLEAQDELNQDLNCSLMIMLMNNVLTTNNYLFSSVIGWMEIPEDKQRYNSSSNLLLVSEFGGFSLINNSIAGDWKDTTANCSVYTFQSKTINMEAFKMVKHIVNRSMCLYFEMSSICIANSSMEQLEDDLIIEVAVDYKINTTAKMFPSISNNSPVERVFQNKNLTEEAQLVSDDDFGLNDHLLGLTLNNGAHIRTEPDEPIMITFYHINQHVKNYTF